MPGPFDRDQGPRLTQEQLAIVEDWVAGVPQTWAQPSCDPLADLQHVLGGPETAKALPPAPDSTLEEGAQQVVELVKRAEYHGFVPIFGAGPLFEIAFRVKPLPPTWPWEDPRLLADRQRHDRAIWRELEEAGTRDRLLLERDDLDDTLPSLCTRAPAPCELEAEPRRHRVEAVRAGLLEEMAQRMADRWIADSCVLLAGVEAMSAGVALDLTEAEQAAVVSRAEALYAERTRVT